MNRNRFLRLVVFLLLAALPMMAQEQTSSIQGTVTDPSGAVLPGVTVEAVSAKGTRFQAQTDSEGRYRFPSIPPGIYTVTAALSGMESATVKNVEARLGASPKVDLQLRLAAVAETISVTAEAPLVDVTSSATATSIRSETFDRLPKARDFTSIVAQAASANNDAKAGGISIDGASGSENRYVVDGVDTTNPQTGVSGKVVITDFIEEVQVKSAGYAAEFGGATGGVINVITKTGTNGFRGTVGAYYTDRSWGGEVRPVLSPSSTLAASDPARYRMDPKDDIVNIEPGVTLGGPIIRDRLWFFGAYQPIIENRERTVTFLSNNVTDTFEQDFRRENYAGTLSGALGTKFLFKVAGNNSGFEEENLLPALGGTGSSTRSLYEGKVDEFTNWTLSGYADFIPSQAWLMSLRGGRFLRDQNQSGYSNEPRIIWDQGTDNRNYVPGGVNDPNFRAAGFSNIPTNSAIQQDEYVRDNVNFDVSWFPQFAGTHRLKAGVQRELLSNEVLSGFQNYLIRMNWGRGTRLTNDMGTVGAAEVYVFQTVGSVESDNLGFFVQDSWTTMNDRLTLNLGVRTERERVPNYNREANPVDYAIQFDYGDKIAPRLGFSYDVLGNGRWKAYGSYGTFYDITKMEMPRGSFGGDKWINWQMAVDDPNWQNYKCTNVGTSETQVPTCTGMRVLFPIDLRHPSLELIEPDLKPMESREYTLGLQHELTNTLALGARYVHKELIRTIEDVGVLVVDPATGAQHEEFFIANPGEGIAKSILGPNFPDFPKPQRDYDALELEFTKRFVNRWSLHASYVYSRLYGNYSGLANSDEAQATPGTARTSPNVNRFGDSLFNMFDANGDAVYGRLATDRPHQFKAQGIYAFDFGTSIGVNQYVGSGTPVSTEYYFHGVPFFAHGRGDLGRTSTLTQTDLYVQHDLRLFGNYTLQFGLNVLNLFDEDTEQNVYDARSTSNVDPCRSNGTAIAGCTNGDLAFFNGFNPAAALPNRTGTPAGTYNPTLDSRYGLANQFQAPREVRVHVKFVF